MENINGHGNVGKFLYWFNLFTQKVYNGGVLGEYTPEADGKIGQYGYHRDGTWVQSPALTIDYRNGQQPYGSRAFSAFGIDFFLYRGINLPEAKETKSEGTFRVKNDAKYLAQQVAIAWRRLGGSAEMKKNYDALVCVGKGDVWVSLFA